MTEKKRKEEKKRMAFLVAVYRPNGYARTTTAGTPHARAKTESLYFSSNVSFSQIMYLLNVVYDPGNCV